LEEKWKKQGVGNWKLKSLKRKKKEDQKKNKGGGKEKSHKS
jgi:hypothetical protein